MNPPGALPVSVVVLTYRRLDAVLGLLAGLEPLRRAGCEVVVVDNGSGDGTAEQVRARFPAVRLVALPANVGVGARNRGLAAAAGVVCVCLDDDVGGLSADHLEHLRRRFAAESDLGAVCFRVTRPEDGAVCDWVHHRPLADAATGFDTYEITEGAVAFRREAVAAAGWYPEDFFISHEGLDLSYRLLNRGWRIVYDPAVTVTHARHPAGRDPCRRHYHDTRNLFWVAARNQPAGYATCYLARGLAAMAAYAVRDGCLGAYLRAVFAGLRGVPRQLRQRERWTPRTAEICRRLDAGRPGFWQLARRRLARRGFTMDEGPLGKADVAVGSPEPTGRRMDPMDGGAPALSVIVPVRNEAATIGPLLRDLLDQTLPADRYEVLVVDGRSEDRTRESVAALAAGEPRLRLLDNPLHLSSAGRNIGAWEARGRWLLFVDGHCRVPSRTLLADTVAAFAAGAQCLSRPQPLIAEPVTRFTRAVVLARSSPLGHHAESQIYRGRDGLVDPLSAGCAYTRELYLRLGGMDTSFDACEDLEFNWRVRRAGVRARHEKAFAVQYRARTSWRALLRQLYRYGHGRARLARRHPRSLTGPSLAVALLALVTLALPLLAVFWVPGWLAWTVCLDLYLLMIGGAAAQVAGRADWELVPSLMGSFIAIHYGAGLGLLSGLVGGPSWSHAPRRGAAGTPAP